MRLTNSLDCWCRERLPKKLWRDANGRLNKPFFTLRSGSSDIATIGPIGSVDHAGYAQLLRRCGESRSLLDGKRVHEHIAASGQLHSTYLSNFLVEMYGNCGSLADAKAVFDGIQSRNVFSGNYMMKACLRNGDVAAARRLFDAMPRTDAASWTILMSAYTALGDLAEALAHFEQMPHRDIVCWTVMLSAYVAAGCVEKCGSMFHRMPQVDVAAWNGMITAYAHSGHLGDALGVFESMKQRNIISWTAIVSALAQQGQVQRARNFFDRMPQWNSVSWTVVITAYAQENAAFFDEAKALFDAMGDGGSIPTANAMLTAFLKHGRLEQAEELFRSMPERDVVSWNAMVAAYAQSGQIELSRSVFLEMPVRSVVSWTTLLVAYTQRGEMAEARKLFETMPVRDSVAWNAVMAGYTAKGRLVDAKAVFQQMPERGLSCWNAIISAHANTGLGRESLSLFQAMALDGEHQPDESTLVAVLSACSHVGRGEGDQAYHYFADMEKDYGVTKSYDHHLCLLNYLGRAGRLDEAEELLELMPYESDYLAWLTLLSACVVHSNVELGKRAAAAALRLDPAAPAPYSLLSNIYASLGDWGAVERLRRAAIASKAEIQRGSSRRVKS